MTFTKEKQIVQLRRVHFRGVRTKDQFRALNARAAWGHAPAGDFYKFMDSEMSFPTISWESFHKSKHEKCQVISNINFCCLNVNLLEV